MNASVATLLTIVGLIGVAPKLPTKLPVHYALAASVDIAGKTYPVAFTWAQENYVAWDEGAGWHTRWKSSHRTFIRILDSKYAVLVWLPAVADPDIARFHPNVALIDRVDPEFLRLYTALQVAEKRDGFFQLGKFEIQLATSSVDAAPMTRDEESLKLIITSRRYGYLYGMSFSKEQWSRSDALRRLIPSGGEVVPLGKPAASRQGLSGIWRAFSGFNSGIAVQEKMPRTLFGFTVQGGSWTPLPYAGVYWYREKLKEDATPIWVYYHGHRFDQQQHELLSTALRRSWWRSGDIR